MIEKILENHIGAVIVLTVLALFVVAFLVGYNAEWYWGLATFVIPVVGFVGWFIWDVLQRSWNG